MKNYLFHESILVCLSLPVTGAETERHQQLETENVDTIWPVPRYHFVKDLTDKIQGGHKGLHKGQKEVHLAGLEDKGTLQ